MKPLKMYWNVYWLPDSDVPSTGWMSCELMYPSPECRGSPPCILLYETGRRRRKPKDDRILYKFGRDAKKRILAKLRASLDAVEKS
jgi:hypothetical protein